MKEKKGVKNEEEDEGVTGRKRGRGRGENRAFKKDSFKPRNPSQTTQTPSKLSLTPRRCFASTCPLPFRNSKNAVGNGEQHGKNT
jgi:hypothetical protein